MSDQEDNYLRRLDFLAMTLRQTEFQWHGPKEAEAIEWAIGVIKALHAKQQEQP